MAFFKYVRAGDSTATRPAESIEAIRQRAKHRLIGAAVLVLIGVVGFPLLFDTQPRPIPVDVQIDIPDKNKVAPLQIPAAVPAAGTNSGSAGGKPGAGSAIVVDSPATASAAAPSTASAKPSNAPAKPDKPVNANESRVTAAASLDAKEQLVGPDTGKPPAKAASKPAAKPAPVTVAEAKPAAKPEPKPEPKADPKPDHKPDAKPDAKPEPKSDDGARAKSLLEGKDLPKDTAKDAAKDPVKDAAKAHDDGSRFIIQVGAFADTAKAQETRVKLEKAGLKTYTHVADTKDGPRTRVRLGPFTTRAEAEKAAGKVKALSLPAAILTL